MRDQMNLFCGIEGGGTKTVVEIANGSGEILAQVTGGSSNPWSLGCRDVDGFMLAARVFKDLIEQALKQIQSDQNLTISSLAICYSGGGSDVANKRLLDALDAVGINYCKIYVGNDCLAPIYTAFKNGGIVLISGTGSNCILVNPIDENLQLTSLDQIKSCNSGGWGNLLGDEGSAYWIAQKAIKYLIDVNDNFLEVDNEIDQLQQLIFEHFQINSLNDLLPYFYSEFKKEFIAGLTLKLALAAPKNPLFAIFFEQAGYELARHIIAIQPRIDKSLFELPNGLPIVCAGSVYKSWSLIKPGFMQCLKDNITKCPNLTKINLVKIDGHSAIGAVLLAAKFYDKNLPLLRNFDYRKFTSELDQIDLEKESVRRKSKGFMETGTILNLNSFTSYIKGILW